MNSEHSKSARYIVVEGEEYFRWQQSLGSSGAAIEARAFQKYINEHDCVLDFGCGGGFLLKHLSCGRRLGVEINPAARQVAKQNGVECFSDLSEVPNQLADIVISNHALEHVPSPVAVLTELHRLMKPRAVLVLKLPIDDWRTQRQFDPDDINCHLYTWTPQLLFNCLKVSGFDKDLIDIKVLTHSWFPGFGKAYKLLPGFIFDAGCTAFAILKRRRQLIAIVQSPRKA
jgi:SAM-dependent methyltransferase